MSTSNFYQRLETNDLKPEKISPLNCCGRTKFPVLGRSLRCNSYWFYNLVASLLHLLNVVLMIVLFYTPDEDGIAQKDVCYNLHVPYASWEATGNTTNIEEPGFIITQNKVSTHSLSLHWLIVGFHLLSFIFQFVVILIDRASPCKIKWLCFKNINYSYIDLVENNGINPLRFIEYAISASIMLVCIALLTGIRNEFEIIMISVLCAVTQLFGLIAEVTTSRVIRLVVHVAGWASLMTAYGVIWGYYTVANYQASLLDPPRTAPDIVHLIVILLFILFNTFGIIQLTQMYCKGIDRLSFFYRWIGAEAELSYVMMSLIAKSLLGWLIYANVLVMAQKC